MELEIIRLIQSIHNPVLDILFQGITILAEEYVLVLVFGWVYWNVDKEKGRRIACCVFASLVLNNLLKDLFRASRPIGQPGIRTLRAHTATGYSFPSGHSQAAGSFGTALALQFPQKHLGKWMALYMILVGLSRLYLGVHYPKDVVVGLILGVLITFGCNWLITKLGGSSRFFLIAFCLLLPAALLANSQDFYKAIGAFGGMTLGVFLEQRWIGFAPPVSRRGGIVRLVLGLTVVFAIQIGLKGVLPAGTLWNIARYFLVGLAGMAGCPLLFQKLGI